MIVNPFIFAVPGGGDPYGAHEYWRVFVETNHGDASFIAIEELEFRATAGGADQATGGTAISSSGTAANAFDGNTANVCNCSAATNQYVGYQFPSPVTVAEVMIRTEIATNNSHLARMPKTGHIDYSDNGTDWTEAFDFALYNNLGGAAYVFPAAAPGAGEHLGWRAFFVDNNGNASTNMEEMEFRGTVGGADLIPAQTSNLGNANGRTIGDNLASNTSHWNVFDDANGDYFDTGSTNHWIGYMAKVPFSVAQVSLQAIVGGNATNMARMPKNVHIDYTDDFVTWTAGSTVDLGTWTAGQVKTITV